MGEQTDESGLIVTDYDESGNPVLGSVAIHDWSCEEWCNHCEVCGVGILYGSRCHAHPLRPSPPVQHRPVVSRDGSDGTSAVGCSCGAPTCDADGWREHYDRVSPPACSCGHGDDAGIDGCDHDRDCPRWDGTYPPGPHDGDVISPPGVTTEGGAE